MRNQHHLIAPVDRRTQSRSDSLSYLRSKINLGVPVHTEIFGNFGNQRAGEPDRTQYRSSDVRSKLGDSRFAGKFIVTLDAEFLSLVDLPQHMQSIAPIANIKLLVVVPTLFD